MLVELSVVEQGYHAGMEVMAGAQVTEVAAVYGVSRQAVQGWLGRYRGGGSPALNGGGTHASPHFAERSAVT